MNIVIYARVSTTRQAENNLSIPDQLGQMRKWAEQNGHAVIREYVEAGASATDDRRPVFQEMISDSKIRPKIFDLVVVHSFSRFFRNEIDFGLYRRDLEKLGIGILSITQPIQDDSGGDLMRSILTAYDAHFSRENSKHVARAMKENARQGFHNGARSPFGYKAVSTNVTGSRGRKRKKLEIDETESGIVLRIFDLYRDGLSGQEMGCKEIAKYLTEKGWLYRGKSWRMQDIQRILSNTAYMGTYYSNLRNGKTKQTNPVAEWIPVEIPPIVDALLFEQVKNKRALRSPSKTPPRVVTSPSLLTGLLKCSCGASMTITTGKSGRYKYYKCTSKNSRGSKSCNSASIPVEKMDALVMKEMIEKVLEPSHLKGLMKAIISEMRETGDTRKKRMQELNNAIKGIETRQRNLMEAIEKGILELDEITKKRAQELKSSREALFIEQANARLNSEPIREEAFSSRRVEAFGEMLRAKLSDTSKPLAKSYLRLLVKDVIVTESTATIRGGYKTLIASFQSGSDLIKGGVPTFNPVWCA